MADFQNPPLETDAFVQPTSPSSEKSAVPVDSQINSSDALTYWNSINADVNGMLGGYPQISRVDLQGSSNFLAKLRRRQRLKVSEHSPKEQPRLLPRAVDCGAGIGRVTQGLLLNVAEKVDVVEPVVKFTAELEKAVEASRQQQQRRLGDHNGDDGGPLASTRRAGIVTKPIMGCLGSIFNVPLEQWQPRSHTYNLIWIQWCLGQLTNVNAVAYLRRCVDALVPPDSRDEDGPVPEQQLSGTGSWIIVKENMGTNPWGEDTFDAEDNSVTRTDANYRILFDQAGLKVIAHEIQRGLPRELYPVRTYALQPKVWCESQRV